MYVDGSSYSCGVYELDDVGKSPKKSALDKAILDAFVANTYGQHELKPFMAMLVASIPVKWKRSVNFLKREGFKQTTRAIRNPNSKNDIALFVKNFTKKDWKHYKKLWKKEHE